MTDNMMDDRPDPFAPFSDEETASAETGTGTTSADAEIWEPVMPAPGEPPPASQIRHWRHGRATKRWIYCSAGKEPLFLVARFDSIRPDGTPGKEVVPYVWGRRAWTPRTGPGAGELTVRTGWHFKGPRRPVPLYRLDRLAEKPGAAVLVCEGEKAADAAGALFPTRACITSQGGSGAAANADWSSVAGRDVTIWPDNDDAGAEYATAVTQLAGEAGARSVRVVAVPGDWPKCWDLADPLPEGVTPETLAELLDAARLASVGQSGGTSDEAAATEVSRVARLDDMAYQRQRAAAAKAMDIPVGILDRLRIKCQKEMRAAERAGMIRQCEGWVPATADLRVRTDLYIDDADLPDSAANLAVELAKRDRLFNRGGPCRLVPDPEGRGSTTKLLTISGVVNECHEVCRPWRWRTTRDGKLVRQDVTLSERVAKLYLEMDDRWGLRPLDGIALAPLLSADGSIRVHEGYDPQTRLWCERVPAVEVPDAPTMDDARAALRRLRIRFRTFAFADAKLVTIPDVPVSVVDVDAPAGADESAFLIMLLTALCRPSLWLAPAWLIRAPTVSGGGTGKGLLVRATCIIAYGIRPRAMPACKNLEELDKRITTALIGAAPMIFLDNVNGVALASNILASAITERPAEVRVMGGNTTALLNSSALVVVTGNGLTPSEDMVRRFVETELNAHMEEPESRQFSGDFLDDVEEAREELLRDMLTIWRWGRLQGAALPRGRPLGSFTDWSRWCRDPLLALGCADPAARIARAKAADPQCVFLAELFAAWWDHHADNLVTVAQLHEDVIRIIDPHQRNRQFQATKVGSLAETRAAGFVLTRIPSLGRWPADKYQLTMTGDANWQRAIEVIGGVDAQPAAKRTMPADHPAPEDWHTPQTLEEL